ncbi:major facilitator superfamily transporter sugar [Grosmannia clavigera kw1407]|uniref:Major facilitator superfamily transporter sugar n=1 Tax=Grosmannia clavigera (strain kw1407 / UAMH 11150) TaxID=655863 RepID=F0XPC3_GROCL|nr:major facilitator superfamily transporter sugar [Grosmannia clavigera kw1407]EFX00507.1 major facilitator superfamily transporter sugar [Grosmannia clavigera kw1407]
MAISKRVYNWCISMVAAGCMVLYGYDASVFNSVQGSKNWLNWFDLDPKRDSYLIGLINTAYTIGAIVAGFFFGGPIADYLGRRWGMGIGCFLTIIATFMQTFAPHHNLGCFIGGRVIIGLGQGLALTAGPVYIGEMAPPEIRGLIMAFWQLFYSVGSFIAYWINYACSLHRARLGEWDWKMVVIFQMLVPAIIIALLPWQPESPRWHIQKNNDVEGARAALRRIRESDAQVEDEILVIREAIEYEREAIAHSYAALFRDPSVRRRLYFAFMLNVGQQLTGQGTLNSYSTAIYKKVWTSTTTINLINALNATFGILFTLNATWTADRFGRRWLFIVGAVGMGLCMLCVSVVGLATPTTNGTKSQPVGIAIVFLLFLFIFFYKPSWGATTWIWTSEVFSMNVRAQAVGMCSQMQNVANTIFQQFFPTFLNHSGLKCLFFFMSVNFCLAILVYFLIPETKKVPLEEIDVLFGGANHVDKGADMLGVPESKRSARHNDNRGGASKSEYQERSVEQAA